MLRRRDGLDGSGGIFAPDVPVAEERWTEATVQFGQRCNSPGLGLWACLV